jgi:hypothetical protein
VVNQQRGQQRGPASQTGRTNYTTVDEIPTEEVLAGMFFLNERGPIIILFDSGESHDFIRSIYAKKEMLSMAATEAHM